MKPRFRLQGRRGPSEGLGGREGPVQLQREVECIPEQIRALELTVRLGDNEHLSNTQ
jgi:hypothetical protein